MTPLAFALELVNLSGLLPAPLFQGPDDLRSSDRLKREAVRLAALHIAHCIAGFGYEAVPILDMRDLLAPVPDYFERPTNHEQVVAAAEIRDSWRQVARISNMGKESWPPIGLSDELREHLFYLHPLLRPGLVVMEMERLAGAAWSGALASFEDVDLAAKPVASETIDKDLFKIVRS